MIYIFLSFSKKQLNIVFGNRPLSGNEMAGRLLSKSVINSSLCCCWLPSPIQFGAHARDAMSRGLVGEAAAETEVELGRPSERECYRSRDMTGSCPEGSAGDRPIREDTIHVSREAWESATVGRRGVCVRPARGDTDRANTWTWQAGKHYVTSRTTGRPNLAYWGPVRLGRRSVPQWGTRLRGSPRRTGPVNGTHVVEAKWGTDMRKSGRSADTGDIQG